MYNQSLDEINQVNTTCDRILRSSKRSTLKYKFSNLTKLHDSPFYRGVKAWNKLPLDLQTCESKIGFKKKVKNLII